MHDGVHVRLFRNMLQRVQQLIQKSMAQTGLLLFVPRGGILDVAFRLAADAQCRGHRR